MAVFYEQSWVLFQSFLSQYVLKMHQVFLKLKNMIMSVMSNGSIFERKDFVTSFQMTCKFFPVIFIWAPQKLQLVFIC